MCFALMQEVFIELNWLLCREDYQYPPRPSLRGELKDEIRNILKSKGEMKGMNRYRVTLNPASSLLGTVHFIHQIYHLCPIWACVVPFSLSLTHWLLIQYRALNFSPQFLNFLPFPDALSLQFFFFLFAQIALSPFLLGSLPLLQEDTRIPGLVFRSLAAVESFWG